jgi:hypothetical protein
MSDCVYGSDIIFPLTSGRLIWILYISSISNTSYSHLLHGFDDDDDDHGKKFSTVMTKNESLSPCSFHSQCEWGC